MNDLTPLDLSLELFQLAWADGTSTLMSGKRKDGGEGVLQITVDMFSGRPNPTLVVEADEAKNLLQQIMRNQSAIAAADAGYQGLGYRGLIVESLIDNVASNYDLPSNFRIAHGAHPIGLEIADRVF